MTTTTDDRDPFARGGSTALLSAAEQQLLRRIAGAMWCAGRTDQLSTFVVSLPPAIEAEFDALIERFAADDVEPIERTDADEDAEADLLLQAVRRHDRIVGATDGFDAVDALPQPAQRTPQ